MEIIKFHKPWWERETRDKILFFMLMLFLLAFVTFIIFEDQFFTGAKEGSGKWIKVMLYFIPTVAAIVHLWSKNHVRWAKKWITIDINSRWKRSITLMFRDIAELKFSDEEFEIRLQNGDVCFLDMSNIEPESKQHLK